MKQIIYSIKSKSLYTVLLGILLINIFSVNSVYAQSKGTIYGVIYDASSKTTLPGATILVKGMTIGTTSDMDGKYTLSGVPTGSITIQYSYVGYTDEFVDMKISSGAKINKDMTMSMDMVSLGEVVVSSQILGQAKAINQQLSSDAMVNVVSEDKIKELPDANAAEAIGRLPGISLTRSGGEASKVVVRGLEPSFTNVTINGVKLASSSGTDRSTDLSMISSDMLAGVEVYKSPTPDMDGESIGGTVNLSIRKAKTKPTVNIKAANIYNDLRKDFSNYQVSAILGKRFFNDKFGVITQVNIEDINRGVDYVSGTIDDGSSVDGKTVPKWDPANLNSTWEDRKRYGGSLTLDYKLKNGGIYLSSFYSRTNRDGYTKKRSYYTSEGTCQYSLNVYENQDDVFSNSLSGDHAIYNTKLNWSVSTSTSSSYNDYDLDIDFEQNGALTNTDGISSEDEYQYWEPTDLFPLFSDSPEEVFLRVGELNPDTTFERNSTLKIDWEIPFNLGDKIGGAIKTGGQYRVIDRWRRTHRYKSELYYIDPDASTRLMSAYDQDFILTSDGRISMANFVQDNYVQDEFLNGEEDFYFPMDPALIKEIYDKDGENWGYYPSTTKQNEYSAYERLSAGYLMAKINLFTTLTLIPGVRFEHSNNDYIAYETEAGSSQAVAGANAIERKSNMNYLVVLPHLHVKFKPLQWFDARFVINKTVGRPKYNQVKPKVHINPIGNPPSITDGNVDLNPTLSTNYDFSVSFYKGSIGLLSAGVFYKDIKDHIYKRSGMMLRTDSAAESWGYPGYVDYALTTYDNMDAKSVGFEIEVQSVLKFLPRPFNAIVLSANYSHQATEALYQTSIDTIIAIPPAPGETVPTFVTDYNEKYRTAPMINQTPDMFNFSIGYDYKGFSGRFSAIYQSRKVSTVDAKSALTDIYTDEIWQLDASLKYNFLKRYSVFVNLNNIANRVERKYKYEPTYFTQYKQYGFSVITGIQFRL